MSTVCVFPFELKIVHCVTQTDHRTDDYITEDNWQLLAMALKMQIRSVFSHVPHHEQIVCQVRHSEKYK